MDTTKLQEIINKSELSEHGKDLIFDLLPLVQDGNEDAKNTIMQIIDLEIALANQEVSELEEVYELYLESVEQINLIEDQADRSTQKFIDKINLELDAVKKELDSKEVSAKISDEEVEVTKELPKSPFTLPVNTTEEPPLLEESYSEEIPVPDAVVSQPSQPQQSWESNVVQSQSQFPPTVTSLDSEDSQPPQISLSMAQNNTQMNSVDPQSTLVDYSQYQANLGK